ncbi:hypothetical protein LINGRAHAP2_LOCUS10908 [Linum grandiflorum]
MLTLAGNVVDGRAGVLFCRAPVVAEAFAVFAACQMVARVGLEAEILTESKQIVDTCAESHHQWPWDCASLIASICEILRASPYIQIKHCSKQVVAAVDIVARKAREGCLLLDWIHRLDTNL